MRRLGARVRAIRFAGRLGIGVLLAGATGCMLGPDFVRPPAPLADGWVTTGPETPVGGEPEHVRWWENFHDPVLTGLVEAAYQGNRNLRAAGLRVIEAQARRAITIGTLFPQTQEASASYRYRTVGENAVGAGTTTGGVSGASGTRTGAIAYPTYDLGFDAAWEVDLWGRFRRAIESADQALIASLADYDAVLVSLVSEVAAVYMSVRTIEERLALAEENVQTQADSLRIATVRFEAGGTTELDVAQATSLLRDTEATIPQYRIQLRQAKNALAVLLGVPAPEIDARLHDPGHIPVLPATVLVDVPAALLERRPDVRAAEHVAAAQSAQIGVAKADLLPSLQLVGTVGLSATDAAKFFAGGSFVGGAGPSVSWPILNYGRIINDVRLQDASFQELLVQWEQTVLQAQREVEDALAGWVIGTEQVARLTESVAAANRAVDLALIQYREGATDYTRVLNSQQAKLREDDLLTNTRGSVARSVVALYKALGGGWQIRDGNDVVPAATRAAMEERTWWGNQLEPAQTAADVQEATDDVNPDRRWWQLRWWWPRW